jgi:hypothetical protein
MADLLKVSRRRSDRMRLLARLYDITGSDPDALVDVEDLRADLEVDTEDLKANLMWLARLELIQLGVPMERLEGTEKGPLTDDERSELVGAIEQICAALGGRTKAAEALGLRGAGSIGTILSRGGSASRDTYAKARVAVQQLASPKRKKRRSGEVQQPAVPAGVHPGSGHRGWYITGLTVRGAAFIENSAASPASGTRLIASMEEAGLVQARRLGFRVR